MLGIGGTGGEGGKNWKFADFSHFVDFFYDFGGRVASRMFLEAVATL